MGNVQSNHENTKGRKHETFPTLFLLSCFRSFVFSCFFCVPSVFNPWLMIGNLYLPTLIQQTGS